MQLTPLSTHWAPRKKNKKKGTIFFGHGVHLFSEVSYPVKSEDLSRGVSTYICVGKRSVLYETLPTQRLEPSMYSTWSWPLLLLERWTKTNGKRVSTSGPPTRRSLQLENTRIKIKKWMFFITWYSTPEAETTTLSRNVDHQSPSDAAQWPNRKDTSIP